MRPTRWLFVALALLLASPAAAAKTDVGVLGGFAFTNLRIAGEDGVEGQSSFAAGAVVDVGLKDDFGIRIEPTWMTKGGKATHRNAYFGSIDGAVIKIDCIDVPVLARFDLMEGPGHSYMLAGLGVSFATSQKVELTQGPTRETVDFGDVFNPVDVTLDLGIGGSFPVGTNRMTIDGRAAIGVVDINNGGTVTVAGSPLTVPSTSTHTIDFRLLVSYLFPWGKK